jgi:hypothetical protein
MEKLLKNKWLMLLIGAVVLYFVWRRFGGSIGCALDPNCSKGVKTGAGANGSSYGLSPLYAMGKTGALRVPGCSKVECQECDRPCSLTNKFCKDYGFEGFDSGIGNNGGCYGGQAGASFPTPTTAVLRSR